MNLSEMLTRKTPLKKAFVTLENGMTDVLNEEFMHLPEPVKDSQDANIASQDFDMELPAIEDDRTEDTPFSSGNSERLTLHTQNRMAALAAFDQARGNSQQELNRIGAALANIVATQHLGREFLDDSHADIRRANELEILNIDLSGENRRLGDRVEKLEKLRARYDQLIEVLKRRETKLLVETESLRETLAATKLEAVEAKNAIARAEFVQGELHTSLATKTNEAERNLRENELLREKNVNLALDLDKALQKQAETRRKYDELSAIHANDSSLVAKMTAKLASEEKEAARLQKLADSLETKLVEAEESVANATREMNEREELYQSENHALRGEIQTLVSRLQTGSAEQGETTAELTQLKARLSELESEKQFAERKNVSLIAQIESERRQHAADDRSDVSKARQDASDQQVLAMRKQIDEMTDTIARLKHQEKLASNLNGEMSAEPAPRLAVGRA